MVRLIFLFLLFISSCANSHEELPIATFNGVHSDKVEDFVNFKNAGFNISLNVYLNTEDAVRSLNAAQKAGVKLFVYFGPLMAQPKTFFSRIKDHPAFYGTYISDEPSAKDFQMLQKRIEGIQKFDKKGKFYVNLFPSNAPAEQLGAKSYLQYLEKFTSEVNSGFISFDYYPVKGTDVDQAWYKNLEDIRNITLAAKQPFWGFANSTIFCPYGPPTLAGLKLQQFGNLLYGAKGLQYFTYWTLGKEFRKKNDFRYSIVYEDGTPKPTYNLVKALNVQIRNLKWIFENGTVPDVYHDGSVIPSGTKQLKVLPENFKVFNKTNASILISMLQTPDKKYILVQNKSVTDSILYVYKADRGIKMIDSQTGIQRPLLTDLSSSRILPGDILIFTYSKS